MSTGNITSLEAADHKDKGQSEGTAVYVTTLYHRFDDNSIEIQPQSYSVSTPMFGEPSTATGLQPQHNLPGDIGTITSTTTKDASSAMSFSPVIHGHIRGDGACGTLNQSREDYGQFPPTGLSHVKNESTESLPVNIPKRSRSILSGNDSFTNTEDCIVEFQDNLVPDEVAQETVDDVDEETAMAAYDAVVAVVQQDALAEETRRSIDEPNQYKHHQQQHSSAHLHPSETPRPLGTQIGCNMLETSSESLKRPLEEATNLELYHEAPAPGATFDHLEAQCSSDYPKRQRLQPGSNELLTHTVEGQVPTKIVAGPVTTTVSTYVEEHHGSTSLSASAKKVDEQWDTMYERLILFKEKYGHCIVAKRYPEDPRLGTWVETQRVQYKRLPRTHDPVTNAVTGVVPNKRLTAERLRKLEAIGFVWSAKNIKKNPGAVDTTNRATHQREIGGKSVSGDIKMESPSNAVGNDNVNAILNPQSQQQRRGRLNDAQWEDLYQRLVQYKAEHGHCLVPRKYDKDQKLSTWVETQRVLWNRDYRKKNPTEAAADATAAATSAALADDSSRDSDTSSPTYESAPNAMKVQVVTTNETIVSKLSAGSFELASGDPPTIGDAYAPSPAVANVAVDKGKRLTPERKKKLDDLGFVWSLRSKRIDDHWDEMFKQLLAYKELHGNCLVPSRYEANLKLGKWVETQRYEYTKLQRFKTTNDLQGNSTTIKNESNIASAEASLAATCGNDAKESRPANPRLTEDRRRRLESIGFQWKVKHKMKKYYDKQWDNMFDRLKNFKEVNGHCMVPKRYPPDVKLGTWVHTQRIQYRKLVSGTGAKKVILTEEEINVMKSCGDEVTYRLTDERRARLESIGFIWNMREGEKSTEANRITRNSYDDQWDVMFGKLKEFKEIHGHCLVPKRYKENPKLGTWVDTQRVQYKKLQKKLAEQGKPYDVGVGIDYDDVLQPKKESTAINEDLPSGVLDTVDAVGIKPLVGRLTEQRIQRLKDLGFVWSLRDDWQKHYEELKAFREANGHCNVPARYAANRRLGIWVSAQRQQYKTLLQSDNAAVRRSAALTQERIQLLNDVGFTWTVRSRDSLGESWNQRLEELKWFKEKHGHCMVPSRCTEFPELGIWVGTQRTQYRLYMESKQSENSQYCASNKSTETITTVAGATTMNESRVRLLEELGFVWTLRGNREDIVKHPQVHIQHSSDRRIENTVDSAADALVFMQQPRQIGTHRALDSSASALASIKEMDIRLGQLKQPLESTAARSMYNQGAHPGMSEDFNPV